MHSIPSLRVKVIGVGNAWRGDDAAGLMVVRRLREEHPAGVMVCESQATPGELQDAWKDADGVIVVDAVASGGPPGTIHRFDARAGEVPVELSRSPSSHGWGVAEALALGRVLGELPACLIIYGIAGRNFDPGQDLSPEVAAAIPETVRRIKDEIREWLRGDHQIERRSDGTCSP